MNTATIQKLIDEHEQLEKLLAPLRKKREVIIANMNEQQVEIHKLSAQINEITQGRLAELKRLLQVN